VAPYLYHFYGVDLGSPWPLSGLAPAQARQWTAPLINLHEAPAEYFDDARNQQAVDSRSLTWSYYARLQSGVEYARWHGLFEFLISADGLDISGRPLERGSWDMFPASLMGQAVSYSLIKLGIEPLHATVVVLDEGAVALLGDSGYGKSTLAAALVSAGGRVLTDDLLVVQRRDDRYLAYAGPPRLKLFPDSAELLTLPRSGRERMSPLTSKMVVPLSGASAWEAATPLSVIYLLPSPESERPAAGVSFETRSSAQGALDLIANTINTDVIHADRLTAQFRFATDLAHAVPVRSLQFPRGLQYLPEVVSAIRTDLLTCTATPLPVPVG
jgi:hypothetical protein